MPDPTLTEIRCDRSGCGCLLGHSTPNVFRPVALSVDGTAADASTVIVSRAVLKCRACGHRKTWRPSVDANPKRG